MRADVNIGAESGVVGSISLSAHHGVVFGNDLLFNAAVVCSQMIPLAEQIPAATEFRLFGGKSIGISSRRAIGAFGIVNHWESIHRISIGILLKIRMF